MPIVFSFILAWWLGLDWHVDSPAGGPVAITGFLVGAIIHRRDLCELIKPIQVAIAILGEINHGDQTWDIRLLESNSIMEKNIHHAHCRPYCWHIGR